MPANDCREPRVGRFVGVIPPYRLLEALATVIQDLLSILIYVGFVQAFL